MTRDGAKRTIGERLTQLVLTPTAVAALLVAILNFADARSRILAEYSSSAAQSETAAVNSVLMMDASYRLLEKKIETEMEARIPAFVRAYERAGGRPEKMDLQKLKDEFGGGMELDVIDSNGVVRRSTDKNDVGFDFKKFGMGDAITRIRLGNRVARERIRANLSTGFIGDWVYYPTPDAKHVLELEYGTRDMDAIVKELDPRGKMEQLKDANPLLKGVNIYDASGRIFGSSGKAGFKPGPDVINKIMVAKTERRVETADLRGNDVTYVYVDLNSKKESVSDLGKVIELTYDSGEVRGRIYASAAKNAGGAIFFVAVVGLATAAAGRRHVRPVEEYAAKLEESESRFRILSDATFEGIAIHDKGVILSANKMLGKMTGFDAAELGGGKSGRLHTSRPQGGRKGEDSFRLRGRLRGGGAG